MTLQRDWEADRYLCVTVHGREATPRVREGWLAALEEIKRLQRLLHTCCFCQQVCADLQSLKEHSKTCQKHPVAAAREEINRLQQAFVQQEFVVTQALGSVLYGYSAEGLPLWGEHTAETLAPQAASRIEELKNVIDQLQARVRELQAEAPPELAAFKVGDWVEKMEDVTGDYDFIGTVVACFRKCNGTAVRVVVENKDGVLHIFSPGNLRKIRD